jgi:hypothetical protein
MDLNEAIQNSNVELVEALLHDGADPNKVDDLGLVPLLWAKFNDSEPSPPNSKRIVEILLFYGANPNALNEEGRPISQLDWSRGIKEVFRNFKPSSPDEVDQEGSSNLMIAASDSNLGLVRRYAKTTKKIDYQNPQGQTALLYAILFGSPEVMKELLLAGANLDLPDTNGNTPRDYLVENADPAKIKLIDELGFGNKDLSPEATRFLQTFQNLKRIIGPSGLNVFMIGGKLFFLFNDTHVPPVPHCFKDCGDKDQYCAKFDDFLDQFFRASPVCVDFFLETTRFQQLAFTEKDQPYVQHRYGEGRDYLMKTMKKFEECLGPRKLQCRQNYPTTRIHNIEFRRFRNPIYDLSISTRFDQNLFSSPRTYMERFGFDENIEKFIDQIDNHREIFQAFLDGDMTKLSSLILTTYASMKRIFPRLEETFNADALIFNSLYTKLAKQFDPLPERIKQASKQALLNRYNTLVQKHLDQLKFIKDATGVYCLPDDSACVIALEDQLKQFNSDFDVIVLDAYAVGRMLKAIYVYGDASIIITYAGGAHTHNYWEILNAISLIDNELFIEPIGLFGRLHYDDACFDLLPQASWKKVTDIVTDIFKSPSPCNLRQIEVGNGLGPIRT